MNDYYVLQRVRGEQYEAYVVEQLRAEGVTIARHVGREAQLLLGDTTARMEIKFDRLFSATGNLFIEVAEKRRATDLIWIPSGINACASFVWYGIGDYQDFFVFSRGALEQEERVADRVLTIARGTSRGYLLTPDRRLALAVWERYWGAESQAQAEVTV